MSRERGVNRERGGLVVPNLADHDNVGVLAHKRAQPVCEREADFRFHLRLVDARELILNRVLNRGDVHIRGIEQIKHGVERGGFPAPRRPRGENHTSRRLERLMNALQVLAVKTKRFKREAGRAFAKEPHHNLLSKIGRQHRHAERHFVAADFNFEPAVLGQPFLVKL